MKKGRISIILITVISCIITSCNQSKSLQELLQEERKAIDRFIAMNDLVILDEYPKDGVFNQKEYFRTTDGLFFNVVDSGNGRRVRTFDDISVRFEYYKYIKSAVQGDTSVVYPEYYDSYYLYNPFSFVYGISQTYTSNRYPVSQAWVIPLLYVGEGAVVNLIVPSSIGSYYENSNVLPVFYKNLRYTRFN